MIPINKVKELISKHEIIEKELSSGEVDKKSFADKSKEYSNLNEIIDHAKEYCLFKNNKMELEKIISDEKNDNEIKDLAKIELNELIIKTKIMKKLNYFYYLKMKLTQKCNNRSSRTGGLEASLFASDLFKMYEKISHKKWSLEIISISKSDAGNLKEVIASIKGKNIYSSLKYESGAHRVQEFLIQKHKVEFILQLLR